MSMENIGGVLFAYLPFMIAGIFVALFALERLFPLRTNHSSIFARLALNLAMSGLAFLVAIIAVRPSALTTLNWASQNSFGLVQLLRAPEWVKFASGFLLLDLSFYYWHI